MRIVSLCLYRHQHKFHEMVAGPREDFKSGLLIEADSSIPEHEVWFLLPDGQIQKVKLAEEDDYMGKET